MRAMKRTVSVLLSLMLVLGMMTIGMSAVSAAETNSIEVTSNLGAGGEAQYTENSEQVTVTFKLKTDVSIVNTQSVLTFDPTVLKIASTNTEATVMPNFSGAIVNLTKTDGRLPMNWANYQGTDAFNGTEAVYAVVVFDILKSGVDTTVNLEVSDLTGNTDPQGGVKNDVKIIETYEEINDTAHYTATVDEKVTPDDEPTVDSSIFIRGHALNLEGKVGVRFYCIQPELYKDNTIKVVLSSDFSDEVVDVPYDATTWSVKNEAYVGTYYVASFDLTRKIDAKIYVDGELVAEDSYSARDWVDSCLAKSTNQKQIALAKALSYYGAMSQIYYGNDMGVDTNISKLANEGIDYTLPTITADTIQVNTYADPDLSSVGLGAISNSLVMDADTAIKARITIVDKAKLDAANVKVKGQPATYVISSGKAIYTIPDIASFEYANEYTVDFGNNLVYTASVNMMAKKILASGATSQNFKNVAAALYNYGTVAKDFFG